MRTENNLQEGEYREQDYKERRLPDMGRVFYGGSDPCGNAFKGPEYPGRMREGDDPYNTKYFYTTHSELNAILNYRGGSLEGSKLYVSLFPCNECAKAIIQAGIKTIIYDCDKYHDTPAQAASRRMLDAAGVRYYQYTHTGRKIEVEL